MTANLTDLTGTWTLDDTHTRLGFVTRHAMITKVRGSFNDFTGTVTVPAEGIERATAQVTINASSIDTRNADRDGHLKSNDFFDMETYPEITFVSTAVEQTDDDEYRVTGDLTIKGVTKPVTIDFEFGGVATDPYGNERIGFDGATTIDRSDFGITFNAALETGWVLVSDKIRLEFEVSAVKNA